MAISTSAFLLGLPQWAALLSVVLVVSTLGYSGAALWLWTAAAALALLGWGAPAWLWSVAAALAVLFNVPALRTVLLSRPVMRLLRTLQLLPVISETERIAIEAGSVWVDGELFSGRPNFARLMSEPYPELTAAEQAFVDGPVDELCAMVRDWDVHVTKDLPPAAWDFIKQERFLGMIIPRAYGGLGFSPSCNSAVQAKLATRCGVLATVVGVPNSIGPAELLVHYGTEAQRARYLPRLASGADIPCFALTEPGAGSDAGKIRASGVVFRGADGALYLRLNWEKRYITLGAIATLLGLAFKLHDPENLLGRGINPGITCALIPAGLPGITQGHRHDPLGVPFVNSPLWGHDVVVPVDAIIGGAAQAGNGWRMLMESLAAGRGISLPAAGTGGVKAAARVAGAYAAVRQQFGMPIGMFGGIMEPLARLGGWAYMLEAARRYTCGGLDGGAKPAVVSAIMKYNCTELSRKAVGDAMDILGGAAISRGPRNLIASGYAAAPIGITVEGANILTRTLMIFGQGAIRCHPYAIREISALQADDAPAFDAAFWAHIGHVVRNAFRALLLSVTRGWLAAGAGGGALRRYRRRLLWASASFAFLADTAMVRHGGALKRMEQLTGRFADVLSWMYLATATMRRFEAEGRRSADVPLAEWALEYALLQMQTAFDGLYANMGWLAAGPLAAWSRLNSLGSGPSDALGQRVAGMLLQPGPQRDVITTGVYRCTNPDEAAGRLERALQLTAQASVLLRKVRAAVRSGQLSKGSAQQELAAALQAGIISSAEAELLRAAQAAQDDATQVDAFTLEEYAQGGQASATPLRMVLREVVASA